MRLGRKKDSNSLTPEQELEQKVDELMDPRRDPAPDKPEKLELKPSLKSSKKTKLAIIDDSDEPSLISITEDKTNDLLTDSVEPISGDSPEIDIFAGAKTAPEIPGATTLKKKKIIPVSQNIESAESSKSVQVADEFSAGDTPPLESSLLGEDDLGSKVDISESLDEDYLQDEEVVDVKVGRKKSVQETTPDIANTKESKDDSIDLTDPYDTPQFDKAVSDITKEDSDKLLGIDKVQVTESKIDHPKKQAVQKKKPKNSVIKRILKSKKFRKIAIALILLVIAAMCVWPSTRYFGLNAAGVRSHASVKIIDRSTTMPLKNVQVSLGDVSVKTNGDGVASFEKIKLGTQQLVIDKVAFKPVNQQITIGWGSNPLPSIDLEPVGARYTFNITDYLSGKAVTDAEVVSDDASAFVDASGQAVLTLDKPESDTITASIKSKSYRVEKLSFAADTKSAFDISLVPAQPVIYVSKQTGNYNVYKIDVDGKNKAALLEGTGSEGRDIAVSASQDGAWAAVVSTRSGKRDEARNLLNTLTLINVASGESKSVDDAQNIKLLDWSGSRLMYVATYATESAGSKDRQRIVSYDTEESARQVLVTSDNFNGVASHSGVVYYAIARSDPEQQPVFAKIKIDGTSKQTILDNEAWTLVRTGPETLHLETSEGWFEYKFGDNAARKGNVPVEAYINKVYVSAPGGSRSAWVDIRDGKGVLLVRDNKGNDRTIVTASGLSNPVRWLNKSTLVYRIQTSGETADYVINIDGGEEKKLIDVTSTTGNVVNY